jgi:hypothetical protein
LADDDELFWQAKKRFAEFGPQHEGRCGSGSDFTGTEHTTILRCRRCGERFEVTIPFQRYVSYFRFEQKLLRYCRSEVKE